MDIGRKNTTLFGRWWWTVDHLALTAIGMLITFGIILVAAGSPAVAERIGIESFYFIRRQIVFLTVGVSMIIGLSFLSPVTIRRLALLGMLVCIGLMVMVLFAGEEAKGARRWLRIVGFSLQPSEFIKPLFAVVAGWLLAHPKLQLHYRHYKITLMLYVMIAALLIMQPDVGMFITVTAVFGGQLFLAGLPLVFIVVSTCLFISSLGGAYVLLPHVAKRINNFLNPESAGNYQVRKSIEAFSSGGMIGKGPGEGVVKQHLPDSHTDFIFAVAGEELGIIVCMLIVALFSFIVLRGFIRMLQEKDLFIVYATSGLLMQFGIQAIINMGVSLHLFPTKGMTLPLISYGGSSTLAVSVAMGMLLALTRKRYGDNVVSRRI